MKRTILFAGGGTMGPVTPLLAVLRRMKQLDPELSFAWAGTADGPERGLIETEGIPFYPIPVAKLPRYPTVRWLTWPVAYLRARIAAWNLLRTKRPSLVVAAGGFTQVPIMAAARWRRIPCAIHQLDAEPGLSNKRVAKMCRSVTTSFPYDFDVFDDVETTRVPTPCRFDPESMPSRTDAAKRFGLQPEKPILFVVGGGTGAAALNDATWKTKSRLLRDMQIIHATGKGKATVLTQDAGYVMREFLDEEDIKHAYAAADLVVSRAGMGGLSDLACLSKPAIFVPIPKSHQEQNVIKLPVAVVEQKEQFEETLQQKILHLLSDADARQALGIKLHDALPTDDGSELARRWMGLMET
jgi:UDP-N-acetylglucosamine--N-acetylmuramyl-(pentapeptide) pyrophosphoryl-undecaprenol N-acetylglucosamine transferase